jgi:hypothetical protein
MAISIELPFNNFVMFNCFVGTPYFFLGSVRVTFFSLDKSSKSVSPALFGWWNRLRMHNNKAASWLLYPHDWASFPGNLIVLLVKIFSARKVDRFQADRFWDSSFLLG